MADTQTIERKLFNEDFSSSLSEYSTANEVNDLKKDLKLRDKKSLAKQKKVFRSSYGKREAIDYFWRI